MKENSLPLGRPTPQALGRQAVYCMGTPPNCRVYMPDLSWLSLVPTTYTKLKEVTTYMNL